MHRTRSSTAQTTNWRNIAIGVLLALGFSTASLPLAGATSGATTTVLKPCVVLNKAAKNKAPKTVTRNQAVPFSTSQQNDSTLTQGQTKIAQVGVAGSQVHTYKASYDKKHKLSGCKLQSTKVTKAPVAQITSVDTYVAPTHAPVVQAPAPTTSTYTNVDGNTINSPSNDPVGASARCVDGTYSYSAHRSGTCSHHGGVASWL